MSDFGICLNLAYATCEEAYASSRHADHFERVEVAYVWEPRRFTHKSQNTILNFLVESFIVFHPNH